MAIDPEELKKRRELRQQQREAKQKKKRKLMLRLAIAAVVLIACGVLILLLTGNGAEEATQPTQAQAVQEQASEPAQENLTTIHIAAAGDLNITDRVIASGGAGNYDYTQAFLDVAHILADADLTVMNLEGNLCGAPYGGKTVSAPQQLAEALSAAGVDLVQLANSYSINQGISGLASTIDSVRAAGMEPLGVYADQNSYKAGKGYTICQVQGIRIAFVAFTKGMDGMTLPPGSEHCVNVLYTDYESTYQDVDSQGITDVLQAAQKEEPDLTIALLHWGSEYNNTISSSQERIVSLMQQNGVDAIIGTHSHYVQQMILDPETGNFVAYSLGDFFGDADKAGSEYSVILDLEITKDNATGITQITNYSYTPIFTVAEKNTPLRVVRLQTAMQAFEDGFLDRVTQQTYEKMAYALERIEARVSGEG